MHYGDMKKEDWEEHKRIIDSTIDSIILAKSEKQKKGQKEHLEYLLVDLLKAMNWTPPPSLNERLKALAKKLTES